MLVVNRFVCASGALWLVAATAAPALGLASGDPIPGVDVHIRKNPGGSLIKVRDCWSGGG